MKILIILTLLICSFGCSKQQEDDNIETTVAITTLPETTTTMVTTSVPIVTSTSSEVTTTTTKPITTSTKMTSTTQSNTVITTTTNVTTSTVSTSEITTTPVDTEAPVITPYLYKNGELTKSSWIYTHDSYTVYQSSEACKWYQDGEQVTDNYVNSYIVKKGKEETSIYCVDVAGNTSKIRTQKLNITQTPKLEYAIKSIDGKQTLIVYANEPVYFIVNGRQYSSLSTLQTFTSSITYDIGAIDEEGHESYHFNAYIKNETIDIVTTTNCGCTYLP